MGESDDETADTPHADRGATQKQCAACGAVIETSDWYLVSKERDSDGTLHIHPFCSAGCQDAWHDESND